MFKQQIIIALLGVSTVAIWPTTAGATTCPPHNPAYKHTHYTIGGSITTTCTLTSTGSVDSEIEQDRVSLQTGPKLGTVIVPQPENNLSAGNALLLCGNPGENNNLPSGTQVVQIPVTVGSFSDYWTISKDDKLSGGANKYGVNVSASPLNPLEPNYQQYYDALTTYCPNANWIPVDYVPCDMTLQVKRLENDGTTSTTFSSMSCTLDDPATTGVNECFTLGYNSTTRKFDSRPYNCTLVP